MFRTSVRFEFTHQQIRLSFRYCVEPIVLGLKWKMGFKKLQFLGWKKLIGDSDNTDSVGHGQSNKLA